MSKKKSIPLKEENTIVPIEWCVPEGIMTPFATNMVVQSMENEFKVSFFEIKPPIQLGNAPLRADKVRADYLAGVIISADRLPKFIDVLQQQLDKYKVRKEIK
jgi:hypothetical protein